MSASFEQLICNVFTYILQNNKDVMPTVKKQ